ncbi:hypothetical protein [Thalassotalea fusca]
MLQKLEQINSNAHQQTFHPNALNWQKATGEKELEFMSEYVFERPDRVRESVAYIAKELAQLAEIEKHVTAVVTLVLSELQAFKHPLNSGPALHHALSCFGAEELNHANTFFRYVNEITAIDFRLAENFFEERVGLYQGEDNPFVKLVGLHASAYVGESVITAFESRAIAKDPQSQQFITELLVAHGLDEHRHIEFDHFVFDEIMPCLTDEELARAKQIAIETEELNFKLAASFEQHAIETLGVDYKSGNVCHEFQMALTKRFMEIVFSGNGISKVDHYLTPDDRALLEKFSGRSEVHAHYIAPALA